MKIRAISAAIVLGLSLTTPAYSADISLPDHIKLPPKSEPLAVKNTIIHGKSFTFVKYLQDDHAVASAVFDAAGKEVDEKSLPVVTAPLISPQLQKILEDTGDNDRPIQVNVALALPTLTTPSEPAWGGADVIGKDVSLHRNGELVSEESERLQYQADNAKVQQARRDRVAKIRHLSEALIQRNQWRQDNTLAEQLDRAAPTLTLSLTKPQIERLAKTSPDLIAGIEYYNKPQDGIAGAMQDTRIDPWALNYGTRQGDDIGIYMTESGCADAGHITDYTRLSGPRTDHAENVSGILRAASPLSHVYCRGGAVLPSANDLDGSNGNPQVHIVTRSNGSPGSNNYSTQDRDWDNLVYDDRVLTFLLAGNNGNDDDEIWSPGKGLNMTTVGAYNDSTDTMANFSSANDPQTGNQKPELSAPGVSITAGGHRLSGTSMATPHAAAFAADMLSAYTWLQLKPAYAKAYMMKGATKAISGGADAVGVGGLDFYDAYYSGTNTWWEGGNGSFDDFDDNDGVPNSGYIEREVYLSASYSNVRIVFAWLNRGSYTYSHRTDAHPIGMDMDITLYKPDGSYAAGSVSFDNPYEIINYNPTVSGTYVVKIRRYANRDTASKFHAGLGINW